MSKADDIIASAPYDIPKPTMIPVNARLLCIAVDPGEIKTAAGIIIPGQQTILDEDDRIKNLPRFIVAAAAKDAFVLDGKGEPLYYFKPGDEAYPYWPEDSIGFHFPIVFDYGSQTYFTTLHVSELVAYVPAIKKVEK